MLNLQCVLRDLCGYLVGVVELNVSVQACMIASRRKRDGVSAPRMVFADSVLMKGK